MRTLAYVLIATVMVAPGFATLASAGPNALYHAGVDASWGNTLEDDGESVRAPGTDLDGVANRVTFPGREPGDGGRFLDARVGQRFSQVHLYSGMMAAEITGRPNILLPGPVASAAWYGEWNDLNGDGDIDDIHDDVGSGSDEFVWRGRSSGHDVAMPHYVHPYLNTSIVTPASGFNGMRVYGLGDDARFYSTRFTDLTDTDEQHWIDEGRSSWAITPGMVDASLLTEIQFVVAADAIQARGTPLGYDLNDPAAVIDVDRYETLSPEAEGLYASVMTAISPTYQEIRRTLVAIDESFDGTLADVRDAALGAAGDPQTTLATRYAPPDPREPNHVLDDYGGHAIFGGVGDVAGSWNQYPGYQSGYHFWVDARARIIWHPVIDVDTGPAGIHVNQGIQGVDLNYGVTPTTATGERPHNRQAPVLFGLTSTYRAWWDTSGDGFLGVMCDPDDPAAWDANRNTCKGSEMWTSSTNAGPGDKGAGLCSISAKDDAIVMPIGGNWPGVIVIRDHERYSSTIWRTADGAPPEVLIDASPVTLAWRPCFDAGSTRGQDLLLFPGGSPTVNILTIVKATSGEWIDEFGIRHAPETVTDVDVYYAML